MALEPLPEKELKTTTGFALYPSTIEKLDAITIYLGCSRSAAVNHLIENAYEEILETEKDA